MFSSPLAERPQQRRAAISRRDTGATHCSAMYKGALNEWMNLVSSYRREMGQGRGRGTHDGCDNGASLERVDDLRRVKWLAGEVEGERRAKGKEKEKEIRREFWYVVVHKSQALSEAELNRNHHRTVSGSLSRSYAEAAKDVVR